MAVALSEAAQAALFAWVPISSRLAIVRLKGTTVNLTVVAVYAPTLRGRWMQSTEFPQGTC